MAAGERVAAVDLRGWLEGAEQDLALELPAFRDLLGRDVKGELLEGTQRLTAIASGRLATSIGAQGQQ